MAAERRGAQIVPLYSVRDPADAEQGTVEGAPIAMGDWYRAGPKTLRAAAADGAPRVAALLQGIRVARDKADPGSLYNRPAKIVLHRKIGRAHV